MKTLFLIRHAKSDWSVEGLPDIDRPLNTRGYTNAHKMGMMLAENKIKPDIIISSPAIRAISTALIFSRTVSYNPGKIIIDKDLYETSAKAYSNVVLNINSKHNCVFLFGHNPIISDFANLLNPSFKSEMSTCGIFSVQKQVKNWKDFFSALAHDFYYESPKTICNKGVN